MDRQKTSVHFPNLFCSRGLNANVYCLFVCADVYAYMPSVDGQVPNSIMQLQAMPTMPSNLWPCSIISSSSAQQAAMIGIALGLHDMGT